MLLTRKQHSRKKQYQAEAQRKYRASLSSEEKKEILACETRNRKRNKKATSDRANAAVQRKNILARTQATYNKAILERKSLEVERFIEDEGPDDDSDVQDELLADLQKRFNTWFEDAIFSRSFVDFHQMISRKYSFQHVRPLLEDTSLRGSQRYNATYKPHKLPDRIQFFIALYFFKGIPYRHHVYCHLRSERTSSLEVHPSSAQSSATRLCKRFSNA